LVLGDGRAFALWADVEHAVVELHSWEGVGPYATIVPSRGGWKFESTLAGKHLDGDRELLALLAAELTDDAGLDS
jgi:hypothetical protein